MEGRNGERKFIIKSIKFTYELYILNLLDLYTEEFPCIVPHHKRERKDTRIL